MDLLIKLNNQTAGRDKIIRLFQYGSKAGWYYTPSNYSTRSSIDVLKSLEYTFSSFRKLLRLGRCLDSLYSALSTINNPDIIIRITLTISKITNALYLFADHITWIGRAGVFNVNLEKWNTIGNKYWLLTIIINITRDIYEILQIIENNNKLKKKLINKKQLIYHNIYDIKNHKDVLFDTIKNICDLFIPLNSLGYTKLSPGMIGLLGFSSSAIGLYCMIDPITKLTPA